MKKILCFGDSNTYGYIPGSGERYDKDTRWSGILQTLLPDHEIIEGGCNNRNGFIDSDGGNNLTGYKVLPEYLNSNPDIVILSIGINDLQKFYNPDIELIKQGLLKMSKQIISTGAKLIIVSTPILRENILNGFFSFQFNEVSIKKSKLLPQIYKTISEETNSVYIDINKFVKVSEIDGLHFSEESHKIIANKIFEIIKNL